MACCAETCSETCGSCPSGLPSTIALSPAGLAAIQTLISTCIPGADAGPGPEWDGTMGFNATTCRYTTLTTISGRLINVEWSRQNNTFALGPNKCAWQFVFRFYGGGAENQLTGFYAKCDPSPVGTYITNFTFGGCRSIQPMSLDIL
jgi:hypothetical protein